MTYKEDLKNAQILLVTLLVMTIISIIVVGLIVISNRDVQQVVVSDKYDQILNSSENQMKGTIDTLSKNGVTLDKISQLLPSQNCVPQTLGTDYICTFTTTGDTQVEVKNVLRVKDSKEIKEFEILKDDSFEINLNAYNGYLTSSWDKAMPIQFDITFRRADGTYFIISDVFDMTNNYPGISPQSNFTDTLSIHPINFEPVDNQGLATQVKFNIASTSGYSGTPVWLSITPRSKQSYDSIKFSLRAQDEGLFPFQMREYTIESVDAGDAGSPVVRLEVAVPLNSQPISLLDYGLLTPDDIRIN
jgi:hypothetical protein